MTNFAIYANLYLLAKNKVFSKLSITFKEDIMKNKVIAVFVIMLIFSFSFKASADPFQIIIGIADIASDLLKKDAQQDKNQDKKPKDYVPENTKKKYTQAMEVKGKKLIIRDPESAVRVGNLGFVFPYRGSLNGYEAVVLFAAVNTPANSILLKEYYVRPYEEYTREMRSKETAESYMIKMFPEIFTPNEFVQAKSPAPTPPPQTGTEEPTKSSSSSSSSFFPTAGFR